MSDSAESALDSLTGWTIVAFGLIVLTLVWGTIFTFTVYAENLARAFGLSSLRVSSVFSIATAAFYVAGGLVGVLVSRTPLRPVVAAAGLAVAGAVALLQVVTGYVGLVVAFGLLGVAGGTLFVIVISLVPQWFDVYQGRATGITLIGNGLGVLILPFVWVWLLEWTDIRGAFAVVGGATAAVVLLGSLVSRRPPGVRAAGAAGIDRAWLASTFRDRRFQLAIVGFPLLWGWYFVLSSSLVDILTTAGIARSVAATAFGIIGGVSIVARILSGVLADRIDPRLTFLGGVVVAAAGMVVLTFVRTPLVMYVSLVTFGLGLGAIAALFSPVIVSAFGRENATAVVGLFTISETLTSFLAPIGMNALSTATGGYAVPLAGVVAMTLLGGAMFYWGTGRADRADRPSASTA